MTVSRIRSLVDLGLFAEALAVASADGPIRPGENSALDAVTGLVLAALGRRAEVEPQVERLLDGRTHLDAATTVDVAGLCLILGRVEVARALLHDALAADPEAPLALARLASCEMAEGAPEAARALLDRSLTAEPDRLTAQMQRVRAAIAQVQAEGTFDPQAAQAAIDAAIAALQRCHDRLPAALLTNHVLDLRCSQLELWVITGAFAEAENWLEGRSETLPSDEWVALVIVYARRLAAVDRHTQAEEVLREARTALPDNVHLISELAELAQVQGRTGQSTALLHRAIRAATQQKKPAVGLWVRLSQACLHGAPSKARHAAERARDLAAAMEPGAGVDAQSIAALRLQARHALADVDMAEGAYDAVIPELQAILAENPRYLPAMQTLGHALLQKGAIDSAVEAFERLRELDPVKGEMALIAARRFPKDEKTLESLERAAHRPGLAGHVRSGLLFQLASAWDKRGDFGRAFALAQEANAASRRHLRYDAKSHRDRCARIRSRFSKGFLDARRPCGIDSELPVFVVGMPRSGTTLVEQILSGHSRVHGAGELGLIPQVIAGMDRWERRVGSGRNWPDCADDLSRVVARRVATALVKELQGHAPEAARVIDKLPHNFENIGLIKLLFPNARIISVRRDPRDIAISNFFTDYQAKHGGMGFAYDLREIGEQLADHNLLMHHWDKMFPGQILEVRYEDVVVDTEGQARRMLDYLGLGWEPQVLSFDELDRPVKTASVWQVRQPIYTTSKAKWMRYAPYLKPLTEGTNAPIQPAPTDDMVHLPEPGLLQAAYASQKSGELDRAEYSLKKLLKQLPHHAAAQFVLGAIYVRKGYSDEGIELLEAGLARCPWNRGWRIDLAQACEALGRHKRAAELRAALERRPRPDVAETDVDRDDVEAALPVFTSATEVEA